MCVCVVRCWWRRGPFLPPSRSWRSGGSTCCPRAGSWLRRTRRAASFSPTVSTDQGSCSHMWKWTPLLMGTRHASWGPHATPTHRYLTSSSTPTHPSRQFYILFNSFLRSSTALRRGHSVCTSWALGTLTRRRRSHCLTGPELAASLPTNAPSSLPGTLESHLRREPPQHSLLQPSLVFTGSVGPGRKC